LKIRVTAAFLVCLSASAAAPAARADGNVETIGAFTGAAAPSVQGVLEPSGYRVTLGGAAAAEVWLRKDAPGLVPSALVGVVTFLKDTADFRGQAVKAGSYTMRYAQMPSDGNHLGAAPTTDFLLLSPLADDTDAAAQPDFAALAKMSARTVGLNHPASLNLAAGGEPEAYPAVARNEYGHDVLHVKLKTAKGEQPIALVVKGQTDH
jgi:hypothetical protein